MTAATGTEPLLEVDGMPWFRYGNQLPHPHSTLDRTTDLLLTSLGQGDWSSQPPNSRISTRPLRGNRERRGLNRANAEASTEKTERFRFARAASRGPAEDSRWSTMNPGGMIYA